MTVQREEKDGRDEATAARPGYKTADKRKRDNMQVGNSMTGRKGKCR